MPAQPKPPVDPKYNRLFWYYTDKRSLPERMFNLVGTTLQNVGRSFALVTGVYKYPKMGEHLLPAQIDITKMTDYLKTQEFFDEIVVLANEDFNDENLRYFLQVYFPQRLTRFPQSRFLFTFSGHGMNDTHRGYLLQSDAERLDDKAHAINLGVIREEFREVVDTGFHVLALINACYGGNFFSQSFGNEGPYFPSQPGAHAITAGRANELVYADPNIGPGSVFFELFFAGLDQRADTFPKQPDGTTGDGVITIDELVPWLKLKVQSVSKEKVNPQPGDLTPGGSKGGFFFFNRYRQFARGVVPQWNPASLIPLGAQNASLIVKSTPQHLPGLATPEPVSTPVTATIFFDFDKTTLKPLAIRELDNIVQQMQNDANLRVHIVGHTDGIGSDQYTMKLSQRHTESVRGYLISRGIPQNRISSDWKGKREPAVSNATEEGRAQNRRAEITLSRLSTR